MENLCLQTLFQKKKEKKLEKKYTKTMNWNGGSKYVIVGMAGLVL